MRRIRSGCCARAASGHAAAAPPRSVMNSRRLHCVLRLRTTFLQDLKASTCDRMQCPLWVKSGHVQCNKRMSAKCQ